MNLEVFKKASEALGIGGTPLIPYEEDFDADIYVKNEAMNASGSVKDRAALCMILDAERTRYYFARAIRWWKQPAEISAFLLRM